MNGISDDGCLAFLSLVDSIHNSNSVISNSTNEAAEQKKNQTRKTEINYFPSFIFSLSSHCVRALFFHFFVSMSLLTECLRELLRQMFALGNSCGGKHTLNETHFIRVRYFSKVVSLLKYPVLYINFSAEKSISQWAFLLRFSAILLCVNENCLIEITSDKFIIISIINRSTRKL